jgi:hypothetical protein
MSRQIKIKRLTFKRWATVMLQCYLPWSDGQSFSFSLSLSLSFVPNKRFRSVSKKVSCGSSGCSWRKLVAVSVAGSFLLLLLLLETTTSGRGMGSNPHRDTVLIYTHWRLLLFPCLFKGCFLHWSGTAPTRYVRDWKRSEAQTQAARAQRSRDRKNRVYCTVEH